ncbi:MATE efflux family protein [Ramaria rubella]|nr:MATE efflux family protein [Ramaria rubella]
MPDTARTPLLNAGDAGDDEVHNDKDDGGRFQSELWLLLRTTVPVMAAYTLQNSIQTATVVVAGRLGPDELSAAAFTMMLATVTGWCIALGGTTALDTLGSQSYTYSGRNPAAILPHLIRCIIILWLLLLPTMMLWFHAAPILLLLGQKERLSYDVQAFLRVLIIGAPAYIGFESVKKYLQCQGIMHASTLILLFTSPLNALLSYALVHRTSLGLLGAPLAISITYHLSFLLIIAYARWGPGPRDFENVSATSSSSPESYSATSSTTILTRSQPPSSTANFDSTTQYKSTKINSTPLTLRGVLAPAPMFAFLRLAVPGIIMVATEWWAFEIVALAAGRLGRLPLAAQGVVMTADQILNTLPFGLSVSASARIGNLIGARKPMHARLSAHTAAFLSLCVGGLIMVGLLIGRNYFGYLFSDDMDVVRLVANIMPLVASFQVADGLANSCGGVLRGQGRQHLGAAFNLVAYYVLALPLGLALAFRFNQGLSGLWIGQVVALFIVGIGEYIAVWRFTDWEDEVRRGIERVST